MQVYKNFIDQVKADDLEAIMMSEEFPWFFGIMSTKEDMNSELNVLDNKHFTHTFYNYYRFQSNFSDILTPIILKINPVSILRIKANLTTRKNKIIEHGMHTDFVQPNLKIHTGIFYVNTTDGYTKFEDGTIVEGVKNTFVEFDSKTKHTGSSCTDKSGRIVINFNYVK